MKSLLFYYMWTARSLKDKLKNSQTVPNIPKSTTFSESLVSLIEARHTTSRVRLTAVGTYLDLFTLFATFRHIQATPQNADASQELVKHVPPEAEDLISSTYTSLEKSYAKRARKSLEAAPDDDLASDPEDSSDDEDDDEDSHAQQENLMAEKRLCELAGKMVLAIVGRVLDHEGPRKGKIKERLQRNKAKLGNNFKEVVAYLDGPKVKGKKKPAKKAIAKKTKPVFVDDDDDDSDEEPQVEEGGEEDLRNRELFEDRIVDPEEESAGGDEDARAGADETDEDEIMGD